MNPIDFFWRAADRFADRTAIDAPDGCVGYRELARRVAALAAALQRIDPAMQSRVAICAATSTEHIVSLLAVLASGKIWVPLNPKSTAPEIARIIAVTEPSILMYDAASAALLGDAAGARIFVRAAADGERPDGHGRNGRNGKNGKNGIDGGDDGNGRNAGNGGNGGNGRHGPHDESAPADVATLIARHDGAARPVLHVHRDDTQAIKFTGGTTGTPKGVMQPYRAWMANIVNQIHVWGIDEHERYVVAAPITHGTSTYLLPVLAQGGRHVIPDGTGAQAVRDAFRQRAGTSCFMPPTLIYKLMALPGTSRADFPQLRHLIYGGAPMPPDRIRAARAFFGPVLCTTYGQTEAPQVITVLRPDDFDDERNLASVGRAAWFTDVAIIDPDGRPLGTGQTGEVVVRGDLVMTGYWRLPEMTAQTLRDGWLRTGDRGFLDERGYLFLKDRLKDMVITGGFNVYPVDVENALGQHPAVHECTVFGVPDDMWGEAVHAAVEPVPGSDVDQAGLIAFVRERLGPVQTPKRIHVHASLPRSPVGKVLKAVARQMAIDGDGDRCAAGRTRGIRPAGADTMTHRR